MGEVEAGSPLRFHLAALFRTPSGPTLRAACTIPHSCKCDMASAMSMAVSSMAW